MVKGLTGLELTGIEALAMLQNSFQQSQENVVAKIIPALSVIRRLHKSAAKSNQRKQRRDHCFGRRKSDLNYPLILTCPKASESQGYALHRI